MKKENRLKKNLHCIYQTIKDLPPDILTNTRVLGKIGRIESTTGAKCLLCIPHGNADSERMFSCINLITTDHRNQLDTSTIEACLNIKLNSICTDCRKYDTSQGVVKVTFGSE